MARYQGPVCRLCRREGVKLFLKGARCVGEKCAVDKRSYAPGQHGQKRGKISEYGLQLREKQKAKRSYGLLEEQFRSYFQRAERIKGITGTNLLVLLETRLDNTVYRLGFANSRQQARQLVHHSYFLVNGKKASIPSYRVKVSDVISVAEKGTKLPCILDAVKNTQEHTRPKWLDIDCNALKGTILELPSRDDIDVPVKEQLIVELYSK